MMSTSTYAGCGTAHCPWLLRNKDGQSFNFTVYSFGNTTAATAATATAAFRDKSHHKRLSISDNCHRVALIKAAARQRNDVKTPASPLGGAAGVESQGGGGRGDAQELVKDVRVCADDARITRFSVSEWRALHIEMLPSPLATASHLPASSSPPPPRFMLAFHGKMTRPRRPRRRLIFSQQLSVFKSFSTNLVPRFTVFIVCYVLAN